MENNSKFLFVIFLLILVATSCKPSEEQISVAINETIESWTSYPTYTPYPSYTPEPTIYIIHTKIVTITSTSTPPGTPTSTNTSTITPTITKTSTPSPTESPLTSDHYDGIYGVGIDIAPGKWQVNDPFLLMGQPDCYWARYNSIGNIIEDGYGQNPPFIITVLSTDTLVEFDRCRRVIYLGP